MKLPGTPRPADRGSFGLRLTILVRLTWAMQLAVQAQNAISEVFELSPFTVTTSSDDRYLSTNAVSGTSLNTLLKDLPMSIQVINTDFLEDTGASDFEEALVYAAGVFTEDHETDWQLGAARGIPGGAAGDKSISSAGKSSFLGNRSYIRGMSVPYQYRMGFRYGGVVVTPYGNVALGGLLDTVNMQRLEVVKGPNATLYGTGVLSGIVNVIAKSPTPEPRYEAGLRAGSPDFLRFQADISGPLQAAGLPGQLLYRLAGATETRGHWTDYRSEQSDYWTLQLDYRPVRRIRMFLEYQDGGERRNGIGPQWFHDRIGAAHDSEFRNEFDEAYNWARLDGILEPLRRVDPDASSHSGLMLSGTSFRGGGRSSDFRITGPDPHVQRNERNLLADIEFSPIEHCVLSIGTFLAEQATRTLNVRTQSDFPYLQVFLDEKLRGDAQLAGIWQSGGVFGVPMQNAVRTYNGQSAVQLPGPGESYLINPTWPDDAKFIQYWWEDAVVRSKSAQFRIRGAYSIEPARFPGTRHTVLLGYVYSHDDTQTHPTQG